MPVIGEYQTPPIFGQADERLKGGEIRTNRALERAYGLRDLQQRTVPDLIRNAAARSSFFSGGTVRDVGRAQEDYVTLQAIADYKAGIGLSDVDRNQLLIGLGVRL